MIETTSRRSAWRVLKAAVMAAAILTVAIVATLHHLGNRDVPAPSLIERQTHLRRAIDWLVRNEAVLLNDGNSALWRMVGVSAEITGDPDLNRIFHLALRRHFPPGLPTSPWVRMLDPRAAYELNFAELRDLSEYQYAFLDAITCGTAAQALSSPTGWRQTNQCRPAWRHIQHGDMFCATHQMMAIEFLRVQQCPNLSAAPGLQDELAADVAWSLTVDPLVHDVYIQRVLMLMWTQGEAKVKPIWLRRVMESQQPDGAWMGRHQLPDLPEGWRLWDIRQRLASAFPRLVNPNVVHTDFHASAQGLLLMALAVRSAQMESAGTKAAETGVAR